MKTVTPTELRSNIYKLLEEVIETGVPLEIKKGDRRLRVVLAEVGNKLDNLPHRPDVIRGNPEELADLTWEDEVTLDFP